MRTGTWPAGHGGTAPAPSTASAAGDIRATIPRFEAENRAANQAIVEHVRALATAKGASPGQIALAMLQPDQVKDSLHACQISMRGNSPRVRAEAVRWGQRGARINTISPGIIVTPLARDELTGPRGAGYRRMIELSPAGRAGTPDEVGHLGALLMGPDWAFITGSDFLMDGGVTAAYWHGDLSPHQDTTRILHHLARQRRLWFACCSAELHCPASPIGNL